MHQKTRSKTGLEASLQPLKDIHFQPHAESAWWRYPEKKWIKEIGIRKVNSAGRRDIIRRVMTESMLVSILAITVAASLAGRIHHRFRTATEVYLQNRTF